MSEQTAAPEVKEEIAGIDGGGPDRRKAKSDNIAGRSPMQIALGRLRRDKIAVVCFVVVCFFVIVAVTAPWLEKLFGVNSDTVLPFQFLDLSGMPRPEYGPPYGSIAMSHPFGIAPRTATDNLAFWLEGCRNSLQIATSATIVSTIVGIAVGLTAGYAGGIVDRILSFVTDFFLTIPFLLAALSLSPIITQRFGQGNQQTYENVQVISLIIVLAMFGWMPLARLVRGEVFSLREREFVQAARVLGMPTRRIMIRELLPNLAAPIVVTISLTLPAFVAAEAGLSYLGIGVNLRPSWGNTINQAVPFFREYPLYLYEPLIGIVALVLSLNLLGDAIRDAMDPKTRR